MDLDLEGRIQRISLSPRNVLIPLFEAVSNSLDAIQSATHKRGSIQIRVLRDDTQLTLGPDSAAEEPIVSVEITDNGVGFNEENFRAFNQLDTRYKLSLGGKGVGRLAWLKVFETVNIESIYHGPDGYSRRTFSFALPDGISNHEDTLLGKDGRACLTTVRLERPRGSYRDSLHHRGSTIASAIARHFLFHLISRDPPTIEVIDGGVSLQVVADNVVEQEVATCQIRNFAFDVHHLKIRTPEKRQHQVNYCARERPVKEERIKEFPEAPFDQNGEPYFYQALVHSRFLDANVNEQRTSFEIDEDAGLAEPSWSEIRSGVKTEVERYLSPQLEALSQARDARIEQVLNQRVPELKYVREQNAGEVNAIPLDATSAQVEERISAMHFRNQKTGRALLADLVGNLRESVTLDLGSFEEKLSDRIAKIAAPSQASLASYILYRRSIIELLREVLKKSGDRFQVEAAVHKLLFPMRVEVDTAQSFVNHNLWLLDERLTFASYIASDRPIGEHKTLFNVTSGEEPDIACYFNLGFSEDDPAEGDLRTVVIVEFKRPGPPTSRHESPYEQSVRYIRKIRDGSWSDQGQKIKGSKNTRFYCFIVCDLDNEKIKEMVELHLFRPVFDGHDGYVLYNDALNAYMELVPFERMVRDAERKHRAFFERLGMAR